MNQRPVYRYKDLGTRQLRVFCECVRRKSLVGAAQALHLSLSGVWQQLRALERDCGAVLLQRHGREWRPTEDGEVVLDMAAPMVASFDSFQETFRDRRQQAVRDLILAGTSTTIAEDLAEPVVAFQHQHPEIQMNILSYGPATTLELVVAGEVDLAVVPIDPGERLQRLVVSELLYKRPAVLGAPKGHPLISRRRITLAGIARYPLILPGTDGPWGRAVQAVFRQAGLLNRLHVVVWAGHTLAARRYVSRNMGVAILPLPQNALKIPGVCARPLSQFFPPQEVAILWRRGAKPRPQARLFADFVRQQLDK